MSMLHGSWIYDAENSYFFLWGETWRNAPESLADKIALHPFNISQQELLELCGKYSLFSSKRADFKWQEQIIYVPSKTQGRAKQYIPFLSNQELSETEKKKSPILKAWQVGGMSFTPIEALELLKKVPLSSLSASDSYVGDDLRFWTHIYRWSLDLLSRSKFLPGILETATGEAKSCWYPLLDSAIDQARFAKFTHEMPPACRAYFPRGEKAPEQIPNLTEAHQLLLNVLRTIIDTQLRQCIDDSINIPKNLLFHSWLESLTVLNSKVKLENKQIKRLQTAIDNWILPIQEYLVTPDNNQLGQNQFRVCFKLVPPTSEQVNAGEFDWKLAYYLQALDDENFLLDAQNIWKNTEDVLNWQGRKIQNPQENLLKGLGLACRIYEPVAESLASSKPLHCQLNPIEVYQFIKSAAWNLQDNGLGVILPPGLVSGTDEKRLGVKIEAEVIQKRGERLSLKSLVNYNLKLAIGEREISKADFEKLLAQKSPLVEIDGEWIALQPADVRAAQAILNKSAEEISLSVEDALRLSVGDTKTIAKLPVVSFEASGILEQFINNLTNNQTIQPINQIPGFRGELRPYQARGVGWLAFLEQWGLGACLADDMGLGKTLQFICFLLHLRSQDLLVAPTLVVCPTSVLNNWEREVKKFAPTLSTFIHHGDNRKKGKPFVKVVENKDLVITSYPLVYRDIKTLEQVQWQGVVLDEAQNIKNPRAKQSQYVRSLNAGFRIALTGTPVENRLSELWSILDFLNPGFLGTQQFFQRRFAMPIEKYGDKQSLYSLRSLVRPFILRRLKTDKDIIQDLPEKQEMNVFCGLSLEQANLYQKLVDESLQEIEDSTGIKRRGLILTLLLKLKQLCNHPAQLLKEPKLYSAARSGKLLRLEEMLEELLDEGDRALIFTQFAEWGRLLQPYLMEKLGQEVLFLSGETERKQRQEMIDRFQNDPNGPAIFILSLKAGGTGLNLTRANHVFHIDRWWNPAVENQATDRAFRIGQKRNVQVHKFICTGTLEEKINDMIESKKQLAEQTVASGENWLTELDTDQLRSLLLLDRSSVIDE